MGIQQFISGRSFFVFNTAVFIVFLFLILGIPQNHSLWMVFGDPPDYFRQAQIPVTSSEFFAPAKAEGFSPRPFTVPLFYKLVNGNPDKIVALQKFMHCLAAYLLVFGLGTLFKKNGAKIGVGIFTYILFSWWNVCGWTQLILSESLSLSFLFMWLATFLLLRSKPSGPLFALHLIVAVLFSFTRDSWPYIILPFYMFWLLAYWKSQRTLARKWGVMAIVFILVFFIQQHSARVGERYRLPILNSILVRIAPNKAYLDWFREKGMPQADEVGRDFCNINISRIEDVIKVYGVYNNPSYKPLFDWIKTKGQSVYIKFLLTHPSYVFMKHETYEQVKRIFVTELFYYGKPQGFSVNFDHLFPVFDVWIALFLSLVCLVLFFRNRELRYIFPSVLFILFAFNAILLYNVDALEDERHLFITQIMVELIGAISLGLILEKVFSNSPKKQRAAVTQIHEEVF